MPCMQHLNTLSFLILLLNNASITRVIVAGYTILSIGEENCIIVLTPKFDMIALNTQTTITICSYFNFPSVSVEKY